MFSDPGLASGRFDARGEHADGRGFSRSVWSEQAENFARMNIERNSIEGDDFRFRLLALTALLSKRESARAGRERRRCVIHLAQFVCADAGRHVSIPLISALRKCNRKTYFAQRRGSESLRQSQNTGQRSWDDSRVAGPMSIQPQDLSAFPGRRGYRNFHG